MRLAFMIAVLATILANNASVWASSPNEASPPAGASKEPPPVEIGAAGFNKFTLAEVKIDPVRDLQLPPITLTLAAAGQSVEVTANTTNVDLSSAEVSQTVTQSQITNLSAAEAGIRDADVASEAANLTKAQVLQQASLAALAQANSAPQALLALLKG